MLSYVRCVSLISIALEPEIAKKASAMKFCNNSWLGPYTLIVAFRKTPLAWSTYEVDGLTEWQTGVQIH